MGMEKLLKYLNGLTKEARADFIAACQTSEGYLRKAVSMKQRLGSDLVILIDRESGRKVRCEDLRPDVDWAYLRNPLLKTSRSITPRRTQSASKVTS